MMTDLFSAFDPATSMNLSLNWMSTFLGFLIIPPTYWMLPSRYNSLIKTIHIKLHTEFKMLLGPSSASLSIMFISLFTFILCNNIMGLLPYVFTSSMHLIYTITLALPLWLAIMIFGWVNHTQHMLAHLIPEGSPVLLMPFMACIETISNTIRPGSLAVRLTANMIAGHLLMSLLGNSMVTAPEQLVPLIMACQISLVLFEMAVAFIQAYVFSVLSTLYTSEVTYELT
uniref:ATP synthase subunit a n=1 Tax=Panstrongylus rufotuberculatus TaxID=156443 RepID=A0A4Y5T863_9HEMI|nr:ATP synthase F0 subunit 6 [Panstrongylus rufotuberculatus]QDB64199.1 ATP synthase F0 subunit 6 [Panstrongylus rufotuberculatus]